MHVTTSYIHSSSHRLNQVEQDSQLHLNDPRRRRFENRRRSLPVFAVCLPGSYTWPEGRAVGMPNTVSYPFGCVLSILTSRGMRRLHSLQTWRYRVLNNLADANAR